MFMIATLATTLLLFSFVNDKATIGDILSVRVLASILSWFLVFLSIYVWHETLDSVINKIDGGYNELYLIFGGINLGLLMTNIVVGYTKDLSTDACPFPFCSATFPNGPVRYNYWAWFVALHVQALLQMALIASIFSLHTMIPPLPMNEEERSEIVMSHLKRKNTPAQRQIRGNRRTLSILTLLQCVNLIALGLAFLALFLPGGTPTDAWLTWQWYRMAYPALIGIFIWYSPRTWHKIMAISNADFGGASGGGGAAHNTLLIVHCILLLAPILWSWIGDVWLGGCAAPLCSTGAPFAIRWQYLLWIITVHASVLFSILTIVTIGSAPKIANRVFTQRLAAPDRAAKNNIERSPAHASDAMYIDREAQQSLVLLENKIK